MWRLKDSNQSPSESISDALPTELNPLISYTKVKL